MWKRRLHAGFHRIVGGSAVLVGLLTQLKEIDLSQLVGEAHAGQVVAAVGLGVIGLEFLPMIGQMIDGDDGKDHDHADGDH